MNFSFFFHEIDIFQGHFFEFVGRDFAFMVYLAIVATAFHVVGSDYLIVGAGENVFHEDEMIGSLNLVSVEGEQSIDFGEDWVWVSDEVFKKEH